MPDPLVDATNAFRRAVLGVEEAQERAARHIAEAKARRDRARLALATAIVQAEMAGRRSRDIVEVTGYSRERVRQILRRAGVEPD